MEYKKNDIITIEIQDISNDGEGIGKMDGYPFFVKDTIIGDVAQVRVTKVKKNYSFGRLEKILAPSPFRVEAICPVHRQCGGCQIQTMDYKKQLQFKESKIKNNLVRIGGFPRELVDSIIEPVVGMEYPFRYRNKAQYPIGTDKEGNLAAGFYAGRTHSIVSSTECFLGAEENKEILESLLCYMKENHVTAYDEATGKGLIRHVLIRKGFDSGELMVCLVINWKGKRKKTQAKQHSNACFLSEKCLRSEVLQGEEPSSAVGSLQKEASAVGSLQKTSSAASSSQEAYSIMEYLPKQEQLIASLKRIQGMTSISVSINTEKTNVIMGTEVHTIWGSDRITDTIHIRNASDHFALTNQGITFSISPLSFYQVNPVQTEKLYSLALAYAKLTGTETVWDLYCGIGTISLFLARRAKQVYGVEVVPEAIEDARENAKRNHIENAEFFVGKAEEILPKKFAKEGIRADVIVVDPPRKGCDAECLKTILKMQPKRIVYVSCDSATLARDLKVLCEGGYELIRGRGVDLFGMTVHCEAVCCLQRICHFR